MAEIVKALFNKFLASSLKSVLTALVAALALVLNAPPPDDATGGLIWAGFLVLIRGLISAIGVLIAKYFPTAPKPEA